MNNILVQFLYRTDITSTLDDQKMYAIHLLKLYYYSVLLFSYTDKKRKLNDNNFKIISLYRQNLLFLHLLKVG